MKTYSIKIFALLIIVIASCTEKDETCDPDCGVLKDKYKTFDVSYGGTRYHFTYDNECTGNRVTKSGHNGGNYDGWLIGDKVCGSQIW